MRLAAGMHRRGCLAMPEPASPGVEDRHRGRVRPARRASKAILKRLDSDAARNLVPVERRLVAAGVAEGQNGECLCGKGVEAVVPRVHGGQDSPWGSGSEPGRRTTHQRGQVA